VALAPAHALQLQRKSHVVAHIQPGQQRIMLKHHGAIRARPGDGRAGQRHSPLAGRHKTGQHIQQGGFAAARRPQRHGERLRANAQADIRQRRLGLAGVAHADRPGAQRIVVHGGLLTSARR